MEHADESERIETMRRLTAKRSLAAAVALGVWLLVVGSPRMPSAQSGTALVVKGGHLINPRTGTTIANSAIVIENDRIVAVGGADSVPIPAGARVVDAAGKFVLPGLWDSHAHTRDFDGLLNIHHGVTSTMDMGNILDWIMVMAESRAKQASVGPRIFPHGMSIGGTHGQHQWNVKDPEQARWAARQNVEAGASFLKVYQNATPAMVQAVVDEARKSGLPVAGHLVATSARDAVTAGVTFLAHGSGVAASTIRDQAIAERIKRRDMRDEYGGATATSNALQDPAMFDDLIQLMVSRNVIYEPNIVQVFRGIYPQFDAYQLENHRLSVQPALHFVPEMFVRMWATDFPFPGEYPPPPDLRERMEKSLASHLLFMRKYAAAGGKLSIGTDAYYHMIPGLAVWQEMELMADAGVPSLAILQAATINPAQFVRQDKELGTVEPGKLADLIILAKNPLENVRNIRTLETVIQHGKVQDRTLRPEYRNPIPRPYQRVNSTLPQPRLSSVEPSAVPIGTKDLVLTITGLNFDPRNRALWNSVDLRVLELTRTTVKVAVPLDLVAAPGTYKVHMITGGRVPQPSENFQEVMVTFGRTFQQRWNGQKLSKDF
jgi:imidazolonepropionase-like amidohydrolase